MHTYIYLYVCVCVHVCMYVYVCAHAHTHACIYIYIYLYIYIYTHTHVYASWLATIYWLPATPTSIPTSSLLELNHAKASAVVTERDSTQQRRKHAGLRLNLERPRKHTMSAGQPTEWSQTGTGAAGPNKQQSGQSAGPPMCANAEADEGRQRRKRGGQTREGTNTLPTQPEHIHIQ